MEELELIDKKITRSHRKLQVYASKCARENSKLQEYKKEHQELKLKMIDRWVSETINLKVSDILKQETLININCIRIISSFIEDKLYKCSCDTCPPSRPIDYKPHYFNKYLNCIVHCSRFYENKGCYYCGYTDCSKWKC